MSYNYLSRKIFQGSLVLKTQGICHFSRRRSPITFGEQVDQWTREGSKDAAIDNIEDSVEQILSNIPKHFEEYEVTLRGLLFDHLIAAEMVIDDLGRAGNGMMNALSTILMTAKDGLEADEPGNRPWPTHLTDIKPIMLAVVNVLITRTIEARDWMWANTQNSVCFSRMQKCLEDAFIMDTWASTHAAPLVAQVTTAFEELYIELSDSLWNEELDSRALANFADCICGGSLQRHTDVLKSGEEASRTAAFKVRRKQLGGRKIWPQPELLQADRRRGRVRLAGSPLAKHVELCEYEDVDESKSQEDIPRIQEKEASRTLVARRFSGDTIAYQSQRQRWLMAN
ncbi:uncharacterized protein JN550_002146 [Neoarthrinium moseri]|uniref:uncharacterized protein n=1 Tax=Neoarthrinium moseri TaxID=1658444 RepID=UPI001FDDEEB6|nr:uncharacterized protein JN550_002146 [Neoarthrinium moseri]KAI1875860.1 hypothetical protein JN550_002146 [Neoarthrinium moseri]